jgi:hypothetical protein
LLEELNDLVLHTQPDAFQIDPDQAIKVRQEWLLKSVKGVTSMDCQALQKHHIKAWKRSRYLFIEVSIGFHHYEEENRKGGNPSCK